MSTVTVPPVLTSPRDDATHLYKAFKGFGSDTAAIVNILAHRDYNQRSLIQHEYKSMYGETLNKRLESELSGKLEKAVLAWMPDPATRDTMILGQSLNGVLDYVAVTEIICSRTPSQLQQLKQLYHEKYKTDIVNSIQMLQTGDHMELLIALLTKPRYEGPEVDIMRADHDAKTLYKAGEKKIGTDEKKFIKIFSENSSAQLAAVSHAYHHTYGTSLKKVIKSETSGLFEYALLTILRSAANPAKYFAKVLHTAMDGLGTNDTTLIRVIVTRAEIDMQYIKAEYYKKHGKSLSDSVKSETSGDYKKFLLALIGP